MGASSKQDGHAEVRKNQFVDTLWNQYEQSVERARQLREQREEAYLDAVKEVVKFNQEFRFSLGNLFQTYRKTNSELVKGVSGRLSKNGEAKQVVSPEVKEQLGEVSERIEQLAAAPIAAGLDLIARLENNFIEGSENYIKVSRERRQGWQQVTDEYVKLARENNQKLVNRVEDSFKVLVK
ncbi:hypothetical protein [Bacillus sp. FJAT-29814]|uniref:hypothetical protein n=1 Tax=Bacillus sp. FJAT-29814 TaxID=1729688 RepID=UPI00082F2FE6|nr:hypothetical protein [Bacillus sp. FJAT-29814]